MIILYGLILAVGSLLALLLSIPVKIRLESSLVCRIQWVFLTLRLTVDGSDIKKELLLFNRNIRKRVKPDKRRETITPEKKREAPKKKIPFSLVKETLQDTGVKKVLRSLPPLLRRCLQAVRIRLLHWNIGLKDYYWQGIVQGLTSSFPNTTKLKIRGNFEEHNDLLVILHVSIWRILVAILLFLLFFPYYRAVRIYLRFRAAT